jgi:hypothetical protein
MRLGKWFVLAAIVIVALSSGMAMAQPISDSDFIYMHPQAIGIPTLPAADSAFNWAVWIKNKTVLGAVAIPLCYGGSADLSLDFAVLTAPDIRGVTYGPAGRNSGWTIKTSLIDSIQKNILCGFISFASVPAADDTLLYLHFKLKGNAAPTLVNCDSCGAGGQHLTITDVMAQDQRPTWTPGSLSLGTAVGDGNGAIAPLDYGLGQNFPNPFNAQTKISFSMPVASQVKLVVYNVLGQEVVTLLDQKMDAAKHEVIWDGFNAQGSIVASGTYFYRLNIGDSFEETRQMTLLK